MASRRPAGAVKAGAICALLLLVPAIGLLSEPEEPATIEQEGGGPVSINGTRGAGGGARGRNNAGGGGGGSVRKPASSIDCQICEATCRMKCLINNLFQWGGCYRRCKADSCNVWCR